MQMLALAKSAPEKYDLPQTGLSAGFGSSEEAFEARVALVNGSHHLASLQNWSRVSSGPGNEPLRSADVVRPKPAAAALNASKKLLHHRTALCRSPWLAASLAGRGRKTWSQEAVPTRSQQKAPTEGLQAISEACPY